MSLSEPKSPPPTNVSPAPPRSARVSRAGWVWVRASVVLAMVLGSGGVRLRQMKRVDAALALGRESPFPLKTIPATLGSWVGKDTELDPKIVEATGSTDQITRHYVDQRTGVAIDVIVLYGPTSDIFIHAPELCYPKAGYASVGDPFERPIRSKEDSAPFRSLAYSKGEAGKVELQEVYYSWRYDGRWSTVVSSPKRSERIPGMYKVQIARRLLPNESRILDNPCEAFLEVLIPDVEARIAGRTPPNRSPEAKAPR